MPLIDSVKVKETFMYCLFNDGENQDAAVFADGVMLKVGFHPERLKEKTPDILAFLTDMPEEFGKSSGGGWSFLNACNDSKGELWGQHQDVDTLLCMGIAIGAAKILLPRDMWSVLPGGVPYFSVDTSVVSDIETKEEA